MFENIKQNLHNIKNGLPSHVKLIAVSKFNTAEAIKALYDEGQRMFGESYVQELLPKQKSLPNDIEWHFIGHLQTNKVKYIIPYVKLIHSVDSFKLLQEINKQAEKHNIIQDVLLEIHIAQEESKYGLTPDACKKLLQETPWRELCNIRICGLMAMSSFVDDESQVLSEFKKVESLFEELKNIHFKDTDYFNIRSWGMSDDKDIAIKCSSNYVRIGSSIFGERVYV